VGRKVTVQTKENWMLRSISIGLGVRIFLGLLSLYLKPDVLYIVAFAH
jgi:hypothetical protein